MRKSSSNTERKPSAAGRSRGRPVIVACALAVLAAALMVTPFWRRIELIGFDLLTVATAPGAEDLPVVIVGIDEPSFGELDAQWPWRRGLHGDLVEALGRAGAAAVVFDVVFAEPSDPDEDAWFAESIAKAGNVVLAGDLAIQETAQFSQTMEILPERQFREAGARTGISSISLDPDLRVRTIPDYGNAMWREAVRLYQERVPKAGASANPAVRGLIRYRGPDHTFPYVSYYQALLPDEFLPPGTFRDKIVFVGFNVKTSPDPGAAQTDIFATPFIMTTGWPTPGVEVQANLAAAGLTGEAIAEAPRSAAMGLMLLALALSFLLLPEWRPVASLSLAVVIVLVLAAAALLLFVRFHTWLPVFAPMTAAGAAYVARGGTAYLAERQRRQQIKTAFAYYVSPDVVEEITNHPERLTLGGDRRELTLLFTDLAGFTGLSEQLGAEQIASVLNRHLTAMTRIIMRHKGTVGKFIGDAIMAFWNAPLEDPDHALHASLAAREMQLEAARQREELVREGLPPISMRIGIHTGEAVVGNMGSEERFDYTAIGDSVNLASRLEGVNKLYGTGILMSAATADRVRDRMDVQPVDRVKVKGKKQAIDIFTISEDRSFADRCGAAIEAYRGRRWDDAERLWRQLLDDRPDAAVAPVYLGRIASFRASPPPEEWDGSTALDKM